MKTFHAETLAPWRKWLADHHDSESEVWVIFYKQHTGKPTLAYLDAVDEALCYGWIDSLVRRLDEDRYARKFTPRKPGSKWSDINRKRYAELAKGGRLAHAGKARSPETGSRYGTRPSVPAAIPAYITKAFKASPKAWAFFSTLTPRQQRYHFGWIHIAKQDETKQRRMKEVVQLLEKKQKLGLK
jgi:uncharacterized protein YdeI (YjbR/CyaY-like superfamily)